MLMLCRWFGTGNHDLSLDPSSVSPDAAAEEHNNSRELLSSIPGVTYLQHTSALITLPDKDLSFRVFASPHSPFRPQSGRYTAFQYPSPEAETLWNTIPADTDVLITHTPPAGICDTSQHFPDGGCPALLKALGRVRPAMHICGHCHEGRGRRCCVGMMMVGWIG